MNIFVVLLSEELKYNQVNREVRLQPGNKSRMVEKHIEIYQSAAVSPEIEGKKSKRNVRKNTSAEFSVQKAIHRPSHVATQANESRLKSTPVRCNISYL